MTNKALVLALLCLILAAVYPAVPVMASPAGPPSPVGEAALLMDAAGGQVLYSKNADQRMYPASTTKIMTALVALEKSSLADMVTVSERAAKVGGTRIGLQPGEQVKMEHLLYVLMLSSANDAAVAIAEHVGGSVPGFAGLMNARAREIGASRTHFVNPSGMPDKDHYTTARDLALISRVAMRNETFRRIVRTVNYKVARKENMQPEVLEKVRKLERVYGPVQEDFFNHNKLLWHNYYGYRGANGIKTGYTVDAGQCIAASARRGDRELIAVVLHSQGANLWTDAAMLLDYGFENFTPVALVKPREIITDAAVNHGAARAILETAGFLYYNFPVGEDPRVTRRVELNENISAPLEAGEQLGELVLESQGRELGRVPLVTVYPVARKLSGYWWFWAGAVLATLVLLKAAVTVFRLRRRRQPRGRVVYLRKRDRW